MKRGHAVTRPFLALLLAAAAAAAARASCKTDAPPAPFEIPAGFHLADAPPTAEQLEFKNAEGEKLVGEYVMFNWATAGWCVGEIVRTNTDGRRTIERGVPANFFVNYEIDDDESKHALSLDEYGQTEATNAWVLLQAEK